ncbi:MAG: hypothetical protein V2A65_01385 [Candidatus Omnitrophota bacterium]
MKNVRADTKWFKDAGWGVACHYLAGLPGGTGDPIGQELSADDWNRRVDAFNLTGLIQQLESIGTRYFWLALGQNSGHYCSPNATYDSFVGIKPSKCSRRDLISDLADELQKRGIRLLVYMPAGAPCNDAIAVSRLEWEWGYENTGGGTKRIGKRLAEFQVKWEAIIKEWSLRWGKKVSGWWIDGCYFADEMYRHPDPPNFQSFASALKAGNPDAIVAFNPGVKVPVISHTEFEDYTAGEISEAFPANTSYQSLSRWVNGAQYHILSYLGEGWCLGQPRFPDEFVIGATRHINSFGGVVTWDVPITKEGLIPQPFFRQLMVLSTAQGGYSVCTTRDKESNRGN